MTLRLEHAHALAFLRSLESGSVDVCVTDPPYGETSFKWDKRVSGWQQEVLRVLKPHGSLWCFGSFKAFMKTKDDFAGWRVAQEVIWEKHNGSNSAAKRFRRVHELAVQFYPLSVRWGAIYVDPQYTLDATKRAVRRKRRPPHWGELGESSYVSTDGGPRLMRSVIYARSCHGYAIHPTQKPHEKLLQPMIRYSCPPGGVVLDPFAGSGSTAVAALAEGRSFVGCDNDLATIEKARAWIGGVAA